VSSAASRQFSDLRRYRCFTKGRHTDLTEGLRRGGGWVTARRGWFEVYDDHLKCGSWVIDVSDIEDAILHESRALFTKVYVLELKLADHGYQFGFNPWVRVASFLPFRFRTEQTKMGWSTLSVIARVAVAVSIVAYLFSLREVPTSWP
jgi:hypothetical protein